MMAEAVYIDDKRTFQVTGKFQTRASVKLQDPEGFSFPTALAPGNLIQWRNLALITIEHDLDELAYDLDILYPLKALKISAFRLSSVVWRLVSPPVSLSQSHHAVGAP